MKRIEEIIREITQWKIRHPDAFFYKVKRIPINLQYAIESIADNGTYEGVEKTFYIHMGALFEGRVSPEQYRVIQRYLKADTELREAEKEFIKLFASEEPYLKVVV